MAVRAVVFDIGGVLERVSPVMTSPGRWLNELSLTAGDLGAAMAGAGTAGLSAAARTLVA